MNDHELLWAMLPEGLDEYFDVGGFKKSAELFQITLVEKNDLVGLPAPYRGRKIIDSSTNTVTVNDYPIRGRKGELVLKRRSWKFEGVDTWYKRKIEVKAPGTKLQKEFALFLKGYD